jgi:hypothetical protein
VHFVATLQLFPAHPGKHVHSPVLPSHRPCALHVVRWSHVVMHSPVYTFRMHGKQSGPPNPGAQPEQQCVRAYSRSDSDHAVVQSAELYRMSTASTTLQVAQPGGLACPLNDPSGHRHILISAVVEALAGAGGCCTIATVRAHSTVSTGTSAKVALAIELWDYR